MKNKIGRTRLDEKLKAGICIPVRVNEREHRFLKKIAKTTGQAYLTRVIRTLIIEAVNKDAEDAKMRTWNRPGKGRGDSPTEQRSGDDTVVDAKGNGT